MQNDPEMLERPVQSLASPPSDVPASGAVDDADQREPFFSTQLIEWGAELLSRGPTMAELPQLCEVLMRTVIAQQVDVRRLQNELRRLRPRTPL